MKNSFSFSRFARLVAREYTENRTQYLLTALVPLLGPWMMALLFHGSKEQASGGWLSGACFAVWTLTIMITRLTFTAYSKSGRRSMAMTLPVSFPEKYLFAWGNSLVWTFGAILFLWGELQVLAACDVERFDRLQYWLFRWESWRVLLSGSILMHAAMLFCFGVFPKAPQSGYATAGMVVLYILLEKTIGWLGLAPNGTAAYVFMLSFVPIFWVTTLFGMKRLQLK